MSGELTIDQDGRVDPNPLANLARDLVGAVIQRVMAYDSHSTVSFRFSGDGGVISRINVVWTSRGNRYETGLSLANNTLIDQEEFIREMINDRLLHSLFTSPPSHRSTFRPSQTLDDLEWVCEGQHLMVCRKNGGDGITWDDLMTVKNEAVGKEIPCIEIYPADSRLVAMGNVRHLWVWEKGMELPDLMGWKKEKL